MVKEVRRNTIPGAQYNLEKETSTNGTKKIAESDESKLGQLLVCSAYSASSLACPWAHQFGNRSHTN
jgi:hypothetical protein